GPMDGPDAVGCSWCRPLAITVHHHTAGVASHRRGDHRGRGALCVQPPHDVHSSGRGDLAAALRRHEGDLHDSARAAPVPVASAA
uniref:Uncharacterized protein n=1 Tax=Aegilops tauschii subsp. strangulata TaxID=200361 RepID=A0A452YX66_AEGTS